MQLGQTGELGQGRCREDRIASALTELDRRRESLAEVAHDARNMVTALGLYCDLLEEPGVLAVPFAHYGSELRLVVAASRRLVEKLAALDAQGRWDAAHEPGEGADAEGREMAPKREAAAPWPWDRRPALDQSVESSLGVGFDAGLVATDKNPMSSSREASLRQGQKGEAALRRSNEGNRSWGTACSQPVLNLAAELAANHNLLSALAGPAITVTVDAENGARPVRLSTEDLTRLLVNLVKNSAEAMPSGGQIQISLQERAPANEAGDRVAILMEDTGPGIPPSMLERIFESGFTTHPKSTSFNGGWPTMHRGLGLSISRAIAESSGGRITASNRLQGGACFEVELPVRTT